jgi:hypothetical protein
MEPWCSLPCSQQPVSGPYSAPDESSPHTHHTTLRPIYNIISHLRHVLQATSFLQTSLPKLCMHFYSISCVLHASSISYSLIWSSWSYSHRDGPGSVPGHVGFVVDNLELGQVFSKYFRFTCQFSFHQMLHTHLSSGAGAMGQLVADVPSRLNLTPSH